MVKWKGYPISDNTWEPVDNLAACLDLIDDFEAVREDEEVRPFLLVLPGC